MKLLVTTQKVDKNDPILGFFHAWIEELANKCELVTVVCLMKGMHDFPENVKVLSLGKEEGSSKPKYLFRFFKFIWHEKENYDKVFVHMNQEYVFLGGPLWRVWGKKVYLWRNHARGDVLTKFACSIAYKVFYTSPKAFVAQFKNSFIMPAGIDLEIFTPAALQVESNRILVLGRISPVKRLEVVVDGLKGLELRGIEFTASIVGDALEKDRAYAKSIRDKIKSLKLGRKVRMYPAVAHSETPKLYRRYKLLINLTEDGSLDKTIFEALASGLKVVVANSFFKEWLPTTWVLRDHKGAKELAESLASALPDSHSRNSETQGKISVLLKEHSLENLMNKLSSALST